MPNSKRTEPSGSQTNSPADVSLAVREGRDQDAMAIARRLVQRMPENADAWVALADCTYGAGKFDRAVASLDRALSINPHHIWALQLKATYLVFRGDLDAGIHVIERLEELARTGTVKLTAATSDWLLRLRWTVLFDRGDYQAAYDMADRRISIDRPPPGIRPAWANEWERSIVGLGQYDRYIQHSGDDERSITLSSLGLMLTELGRWGDAKCFLLRRLAFVPRRPVLEFDVYLDYAKCLYMCADYDELLSLCNEWMHLSLRAYGRTGVRMLMACALAGAGSEAKAVEVAGQLVDRYQRHLGRAAERALSEGLATDRIVAEISALASITDEYRNEPI